MAVITITFTKSDQGFQFVSCSVSYPVSISKIIFLKMYFALHRDHIISLVIDKGNKSRIQSTEYLLLKKKRTGVGVGMGLKERAGSWFSECDNNTSSPCSRPTKSISGVQQEICIFNKPPWELLHTLNFETTALQCTSPIAPMLFFLIDSGLHPSPQVSLYHPSVCVRSFYVRFGHHRNGRGEEEGCPSWTDKFQGGITSKKKYLLFGSCLFLLGYLRAESHKSLGSNLFLLGGGCVPWRQTYFTMEMKDPSLPGLPQGK